MDLDSYGKIAYSGTIQGRSFKEMGEKGFYVITLNKNLPMNRQFVSCNPIEWVEIEFLVEEVHSIEQIVSQLYREILIQKWNDDKTYLLKFVLIVDRGFNQTWLKLIEDLLQKEISKKYEKLYLIEMDVEFRKLKRNNQLSIELLEDEESHLNRLQDIQNIAMQHTLLAKYFSKEMSSEAFQHKMVQRAKVLIETNMEVGDENVY